MLYLLVIEIENNTLKKKDIINQYKAFIITCDNVVEKNWSIYMWRCYLETNTE